MRIKNDHLWASCICALVLVCLGLPCAWGSGNIDPTNKYAWGENVGWINASPSNGGVTVHYNGTNGYLTGYAWGENIGWIKMGDDSGGPYANNSSTDWGVNLDAPGNLSGLAWGENVGWIKFSSAFHQATVDMLTGRFDGFAWGENIGWLKFKGSVPAYNIRTTAFDPKPILMLTNGLVAYYPLNANLLDYSENGHTGICYYGGTSFTSNRLGQSSNALFFTGSSRSNIIRQSTASISLASNFTFAAWIRPDALPPSTDFPLTAPSETTSGTYYWSPYLFMPEVVGGETIDYYDKAGIGISATPNYIAVHEHGYYTIVPVLSYAHTFGSSWFQVTVVCKDNELQLFVNGQYVRSALQSGRKKVFYWSASPNFSNGSYGDSGLGGGAYGYYNGGADDVRIYSRALATNEVLALYNEQPINVVTVLTDRASVSIPEGGSTNFQVKLSAQPIGDTVVTVSRTAGDTDISVTGDTNLTFSTANWGVYQTVTLTAAEDNGDNVSGTATISCSSAGVTQAVVLASEIDDDFTLGTTAINGGITQTPDSPYYDNGSSVFLTAIQNAGYHFTGWSGDASGTNNPVSVTMDSDKSVTASFTMNVITALTDVVSVTVPEGGSTNFQVKLSAQPTGDTVVVVAWLAGDPDVTPTAGTNLTFATHTWDVYQIVTLTAAEDNGDDSNGVTLISCSGLDITNAIITATEIDDDYTLNISAINGAVAKNPDTPLYDSGTAVSLGTTPDAGYHFMGWSGEVTGTTNPVFVTVTSNTSVTANFVLNVITILTDRASVSVPEGGSTNFQVKLNRQPTGDTIVTVARTSGDTNITVSFGDSRTFSTANWNAYQTVTLTTAEDDEDNVNGTATITCSGSGITNAVVTATEIDDDHTLSVTAPNGTVTQAPDTPYYDNDSSVLLTAVQNAGYHFADWTGDVNGTNNPVSVTMNSNKSVVANFALNVITVLTDRASVSVPEGSATNFQVKLSAQPTGDTVVVVAWTSGDADISVSAGTNLTFTTNTWAAYQSVTLAAAEDNGDNVNGVALITCSSIGVTQAVVTATEADDDYALSVSTVNGSVSKAPDTPYYDNGASVSLTAIQNAGYHFTGWSGDAAGTNNPVNVTVTNSMSVTANFALNEIAILTDRASVSVPEGGTTNFQVKLSAQPTGDTAVAVARTAGDTDIAVSGGSSLTFSTVNWNAYQVATLSAAEDNDDNANGTATITCSGAGITNATVQATEIDDEHTLSVTALNGVVTKDPDTAYYDNGASATLTAIQSAGYHFVDWAGDALGTNNPVSVNMNSNKSVTANFVLNVITVMTDWASISVPEGSSTNFQVKLNVQPTGDTVVVVAWTSGDPDITPTAGTNLTFATNTWDVYQSVALMAAEDNEDNSNGMATITCSGTDITNTVVTATEIDDDYTLAVTAINGAVAKNPDRPLYDNGTSVSLEATQSAGYHFMGWSGAAAGITNPVALTVTSNTSVTAYFALNVITVLADRASISVPEGYSTNFQVKLSAQPTGDTVVAVSRTSGDTDVNVTAGGSLSFTVSNWTNYQTVTVFAGEDNGDNVNGTATISCRGSGLADATVEAIEVDDDYTLTVISTNGSVATTPDAALFDNGMEVTLTATQNAGHHFTGWSGGVSGITNPVTLIMDSNKSVTAHFVMNVVTVLTDRSSVNVPEGGVTNFQVKLSAQPTGLTSVGVARSSGDTDISVFSGSSLTFSIDDWGVYQPVTLAAAEDNGDNANGQSTITCSSPGISNADVIATEVDDDYTLTVSSLYGTVDLSPNRPFYDNGKTVTLTVTPGASYFFKSFTGDLTESNNPAAIIMTSDKQVTAEYGPIAPDILPPRTIGKKNFTARWKWVDGGAPEGFLSVTLGVEGFPQYLSGYRMLYVVNSPECLVANLIAGKSYYYRVRRVMPDGSYGPWSAQVKVQTGTEIPVFKNLLSDVPVSKGIVQEFAISNLITGVGTLGVKSSNTNAVKATVTTNALTLQYLWNGTNAAYVTLTLTHPATGYKIVHGAALSQAVGGVAIVGQSALTNAGTVVAQELTLENRTGGTVYGVRVRALGLDQTAWLINQTGLDPVSRAAIVEVPCMLPPGSQMVARLMYNTLYKKQARTRVVTYGAWVVMTPVNGALPVKAEMTITRRDLYDGLWLLRLPANRNRLYKVYHSDNGGANWKLDMPVLRATANYLMWLDVDEGTPAERLYRVVDAGM
jgi:uncharacterized repeat protein (TIGR02543 family)